MKYQGACHCKKVQFEVEMNVESTMTCTCSHCAMKGFILNFVPKSAFTLTSGEDNLTTYHFNKKVIDHTFCKDCGIQPFGFGKNPDGGETVMINLRCIEGLDLKNFPTIEYDGKSL